ncbi:MAG: hypothetical protein ACRAUW_12415, partial [Aeromonas sp.]
MLQPTFHQFDAHPLADTLLPYRGEQLDVLLAERDATRVAELQQQCQHLDIQLCGAIFPSLVSQHGFHEQGAWLLPRPVS